ncbi:BlaI/MecI/CopY family transcriptional regulator, partial [Acidobacteria bacterium AH-259-O06]|nr:BlaI/MecI/CopY family transcriptional regulator [Acidobacteria bacterium AH-259-O06]
MKARADERFETFDRCRVERDEERQPYPASARDVLEALEGEKSWAYTTVKTILNRLVEKGAL